MERKLTIATAGDASISAGLITVKYAMFVNI